MKKLAKLKVFNCNCEQCQKACQRPCWGTPEDIQKIIDAGYGNRLMLDYWLGEDVGDIIFVLCPALKGYEGKEAPYIPISKDGCTFFKDGKCELHNLGLKPIEGKITIHKELRDKQYDKIDAHKIIAKEWKKRKYKKLIEQYVELSFDKEI